MLLVLVAVASAVIGLSGRYYLSRSVRYVIATRNVNGYQVSAAWSENRLGNENLLWLVVWADGDKSYAGSGDGTSSRLRFPSKNMCSKCLCWYNSGIYYDDKLLDGYQPGECWIYQTTDKSLRKIAMAENPMRFSKRVFNELETTPVWKQVFEPLLIAESEAFWTKYEKEFGSRPRSKRRPAQT